MLRQHLPDEKAIVFCEFREEMVSLQQHMQMFGITSALYDGSLSALQRDYIVKCMSWTKQQICDFGKEVCRTRHFPKDVARIIEQFVSFDAVIVSNPPFFA